MGAMAEMRLEVESTSEAARSQLTNSTLHSNQAYGGNGASGATPPERLDANGNVFNPGEVGDGEHGERAAMAAARLEADFALTQPIK